MLGDDFHEKLDEKSFFKMSIHEIASQQNAMMSSNRRNRYQNESDNSSDRKDQQLNDQPEENVDFDTDRVRGLLQQN